MTLALKILNHAYFNDYKTQLKFDVDSAYAIIKNIPQTLEDFKFYLANSSVHSSNIEGNTASFDTYLKSSEFNLHPKTKKIKEIEDLITAYQFTRENDLTLNNALKAHEILTLNKHFCQSFIHVLLSIKKVDPVLYLNHSILL